MSRLDPPKSSETISTTSSSENGETEFSFYGATCDSADYMKGPFKLPANIKTDDWIVVHQTGAYSSALQTGFNGFNSGYVVVVDN